MFSPKIIGRMVLVLSHFEARVCVCTRLMKWEHNLTAHCTVLSSPQHYLLKRHPSRQSVKIAQDKKLRFIFLTGPVLSKNDLLPSCLGAVLRRNSMVWAHKW